MFDSTPTTPPELVKPKHVSQPKADVLEDLLPLNAADCLATRLQHAKLVRHLPVYPEKTYNGSGIVMLAGGIYSEYAATSLGMIREMGSMLPVEVWMKDKSEEKKGWCAELEREGMACRMLADYMDTAALSNPYQLKVFTIFFSSFEEVLFLDADNMPMKNPDSIFHAVEYRKWGAVLWPDYWPHSGSPWLPYILGISDERSEVLKGEISAESGQILWNKRTHWKVSLCRGSIGQP